MLIILTFDDVGSVLWVLVAVLLVMHVYHGSIWVLLMLLNLLLMLDHVDVFHNVCIWGGDLLRVHRLLRRVLRLLQVHLLVLSSGRLRHLRVEALLARQSRLAGIFALFRPTDRDCGLAVGGSAGELRLRSACYSESLRMLMVRSYPMSHVVVHFG